MREICRDFILVMTLVCVGCLLASCGKEDAVALESEMAHIEAENMVSETETAIGLRMKSVDTFHAALLDIDIDDFLKACLGDSVTFEQTGINVEGEEFQALIDGAEYLANKSEGWICVYAKAPSVIDEKELSEDDIRKKCDEIVQKLNWGSVTITDCSLEADEEGSYYSLLYEFNVDGIPVIGNRGFAVPGTGGEEFIAGEYLTIEYGTELRSLSASRIRKIGDISGTMEILSEEEAEEAAGQYFEGLERGGIEVNQIKQDMQLVYIPYPTDDMNEELIPAWQMCSVDDNGGYWYTIIDAESGYVYMNGL